MLVVHINYLSCSRMEKVILTIRLVVAILKVREMERTPDNRRGRTNPTDIHSKYFCAYLSLKFLFVREAVVKIAMTTTAPSQAPTGVPTTFEPTIAPSLAPSLSPTAVPTLSPAESTPGPTSTEEWLWHNEYSGAVLTEYTVIVWGILALITAIFIRR